MNPFVVVISNAAGPEQGEKPVAAGSFSPTRRGRGPTALLNSTGAQGARNLFRASLLNSFQEPGRICAEVFHVLSPFAAVCGLVGVFDGHEHAEGKMKCPTVVMKDLTK